MSIIERSGTKMEFFTPERCHIRELFNRDDDPACSIARARIEPGVTTQLHSLSGVTERYVILQGQGQAEIGGEVAGAVGPLDIIQIGPGISQRITNTGNRDLIFLCICTPRFTVNDYIDLETSTRDSK